MLRISSSTCFGSSGGSFHEPISHTRKVRPRWIKKLARGCSAIDGGAELCASNHCAKRYPPWLCLPHWGRPRAGRGQARRADRAPKVVKDQVEGLVQALCLPPEPVGPAECKITACRAERDLDIHKVPIVFPKRLRSSEVK